MKNKVREENWCDKENIKCLCCNCSENKTKIEDGKCDGCNDCGTCTDKPCLLI